MMVLNHPKWDIEVYIYIIWSVTNIPNFLSHVLKNGLEIHEVLGLW